MSLVIQKSNANLKGVIDDIVLFAKSEYEKTRLKRTQFYYFLLEMEKALVYSDYKKGAEYGLKTLKLLEESNFLFSKKRLGNVYSYLSHNELCSLNLIKSSEFEKKAKQYFTTTSLDNVTLKEFAFLSNFYSSDSTSASKILGEAFDIPTISDYPFYQSKFNYYQAMIYFIEEDFDRAWKALSIHFDLEKDKEGWRVWLSIMRILCQIERREFVDVDLMVQTFKKYIKKWEERSEIREREKLVFKIIESLNRNDFDYSSTNQEHADTLVLLKSKVKELRWRPNSPELIIFQDWFKSKVEKKPYSPSYSAYKLSD